MKWLITQVEENGTVFRALAFSRRAARFRAIDRAKEKDRSAYYGPENELVRGGWHEVLPGGKEEVPCSPFNAKREKS
jgi:hypothetical protein